MRVETPAEKSLYCTVRLETEGPQPNQRGAGTAFVFTLRMERGRLPCLVTNRHVIAGTRVGRFFFTARRGDRPNVGERLDIEMDNFEAQWHGHPDPRIDIATMPLGPVLHRAREAGKEAFYSSLDQRMIPTAQQLEELDVLEEVTFVGYPSGIYDSVHLLPVFRRGITATPLQIDHDDRPVFLIDASVFPGSSGSPVLMYNLGGYATRKGWRTGRRVLFLGVVAEATYRREHGQLEFRSAATALVPVITTREMLDLGVVYKASAVLETVQGLYSLLKAEGSI